MTISLLRRQGYLPDMPLRARKAITLGKGKVPYEDFQKYSPKVNMYK